MRTDLEELQSIAARRGWRLEWRRSTWNLLGWDLYCLDLVSGGERVGGAATACSCSLSANFSPSEKLAEMILSTLPGRGAEGNGIKPA